VNIRNKGPVPRCAQQSVLRTKSAGSQSCENTYRVVTRLCKLRRQIADNLYQTIRRPLTCPGYNLFSQRQRQWSIHNVTVFPHAHPSKGSIISAVQGAWPPAICVSDGHALLIYRLALS